MPEEFYLISSDPNCLENLIGYTEHRPTIDRLRKELAASLAATEDPVAPLLDDVYDVEKRTAFMEQEDARSEAIKRAKRNRNTKAGPSDAAGSSGPATRRALRDAIRLESPAKVKPGADCSVTIHYQLPVAIGAQKLHVTLKTAAIDPKANVNARIHREVLTIKGSGQTTVRFDVPAELSSEAVRIAAFVGEEFQSNLQYLQSDPIPVE